MRGHEKNTKYRKALKAAFPHNIPIFAGSMEFVAAILGVLPASVFGLLIVYCLKDVDILGGSLKKR